MSKTVIWGGTFVTMDEPRTIQDGALVIEGDTITYIGAKHEQLKEGADDVIDGRGRCYLPGLVNTHGHAAMSLLRGYADDLNLQVWLEQKMWPMEGKFTEQDVHWGTTLSIAEMIRSGTTCFVDMYDKMHIVAGAVESSGMRATLTRGIIGFPRELQQAKLEEATTFAKTYNGAADGRIRTMMSPHAPYTCEPDFIAKVLEAAHALDLPVHTHMSETAKEVQLNVDQYGVRPVEHLRRLGVFDRPCLVAHAVHLTDEEIDILKQYDVRVSHNPGSNLKLASGVARVNDLRKAGVRVSLGTDSSASNNNLDMFEEIRLAALLQKGISGDPEAVPAWDALAMGTSEGASSLWLNDAGKLAAGYKADLIAVDIEQPHYYPLTDIVSHLVYSGAGQDVQDVCVNGRWLMRNRELLTVDMEQALYEAQRCLDRLDQ